jgi:multidrug efflux pump subunit AcrB
VSIGEVVAALSKQNVSAPAGTIYSLRNEYLVKTTGEFANLQQIRDLPIRISEQGLLRVTDVARVSLDEAEQRSIYHGNGKPAIAVNVLRPDNGPTMSAIQSFKGFLPALQAQYPDIQFEITDDQQPIIDMSVSGMRDSLWLAVLLTVLVIFAFLADMRAAVIASISIPLAFLASLVVLWFSPYTMNLATLSGMIVAVGMVVDASVVVLENIYRHYRNMKHPDAVLAAREGTGEVALAVTACMFTTVIVLIPVMFAQGYTQQMLRPLNLMISATLIASLLVALTVLPLMASRLLARPHERRNLLERLLENTDKGVGYLSGLYLGILRKALRWRLVTLILAAVFFLVTMKVVKPLIGTELMPPMDTGIVILEFDAVSDASPVEVEKTLNRIEEIIYAQPGVKMVSSVVGSEPGQISFGGGGATAQSGKLTINLVDRTRRDETIWQIQDKWRSQLRHIAGVRSFRLTEYGATAVSSTRAPLDVIISGPDSRVISRLADQCLETLKGVPGLTDVRRSWYFDKTEYHVEVDPALARLYQTTPADMAGELKGVVKGIPASAMRLTGYLDIPITVQYAAESINDPAQLSNAYVSSKFGPMPLRSMATLAFDRNQPFITRERLRNTIDITGVNRVYTIGQVAVMVQERLSDIHLPAGYNIEVSGTMADMRDGNSEMGRALLIGFVLLYILLVAMFRSFGQPITIMAAIPLAVAGALWGLLLFDKPMCTPAMMGMILLGGTIVNNSILLLDFILRTRKSGIDKNEAILQSIRLRIRPILMTTGSTIIGLLPLVFERALGLERLSPIGVVAAMGLLVGTFLTMIVVPTVYSSMDSLSALIGRTWLSIFSPRREESQWLGTSSHGE